jgi:hypothetical protein
LTTTLPTHKYSAKPPVSTQFFLRLRKQYCAVNECIRRTGAGLKAEDVVSGSEIANVIGMLNLCILQCIVNPTNHREGNGELQVVAEATQLLVHVTKLQPIYHLL